MDAGGEIAEIVGLSQNRVSEIIGNTRFGEIDNLASQGRNMDYIARHYHIDLPLVWAIRLEGNTDQERFEELGWGLRTWDQWSFKEWGTRFGDDWPVRHRKLRRGRRVFGRWYATVWLDINFKILAYEDI